MKLLIQYLTDDRRHFSFPHFLNLINKSTVKNVWMLLILTHSNDENFYKEMLEKYDINYKIIRVSEHNNYLTKVKYSINYAEENNIPYIMKCDNDIFFKGETLDYMIQNLELINNTNNLTMVPILSSGIPNVEYFCDGFLDEDAKQKIYDMFLNTKFGIICGTDYESLNNVLYDNKWNKDLFFNQVKQLSYYYKGIHPIRINYDAINYLNNYIIDNKDRYFNNNDAYDLIFDNNSPYLCNGIFCIKREVYKDIVYDDSLYVDPFEEVPLNKYCWKHNMNHIFIKNGYAIHILYNWYDGYIEYEKKFCELFFK